MVRSVRAADAESLRRAKAPRPDDVRCREAHTTKPRPAPEVRSRRAGSRPEGGKIPPLVARVEWVHVISRVPIIDLGRSLPCQQSSEGFVHERRIRDARTSTSRPGEQVRVDRRANARPCHAINVPQTWHSPWLNRASCVFRKRRAVATPPPDPGERSERVPLELERNHRKVHLVEVLVEEDRDLEQGSRGEPRHPHASVPLQAKECTKPLFAESRRSELDQEVRDPWADVPQAVRRAGRHDESLAGTQRPPLAAEPEAELPAHSFEALPLVRVDVRRDIAPRADEELSGDTLRRAYAEDDALTRHRIDDCVYALADRLI